MNTDIDTVYPRDIWLNALQLLVDEGKNKGLHGTNLANYCSWKGFLVSYPTVFLQIYDKEAKK